MKSFSLALAGLVAIHGSVFAQQEAPSAKDLASQLAALQQDGSCQVRLKMDVKADGRKFALQLQIKQRRSKTSTELVYQVLWPKERAGEAVLLKSAGGEASGATFVPPDAVKNLSSGQMNQALLGSALTYADVLENFYAWESQKIVGAEAIGKVTCQILESRPAKGQRSSAAVVRSWIDTRKNVPLKVEKYSASGEVIRRITTIEVASDDLNRNIPAVLTIEDLQRGATTELAGSKLKHGVTWQDRDFTAEGLKDPAQR